MALDHLKVKSKTLFSCGHPFQPSEVCHACARNRRKAKNLAAKLKQPAPGRLPEGSRKLLVWTGTVWQGRLFVPNCPEMAFEADTEKKCFHGLDAEYRRYLIDNPPRS